MVEIVWDRDAGVAACDPLQIHIICDVRNELNSRRPLHDPKQVVRSVVNGREGPPYMPRPFPKGRWRVTGVEWTNVKDFAPVKIKTDAHQTVSVWVLDAKGGYDHETQQTVEDSGYYLHFCAWSKTTLGCGRVGTDTDAEVRLLARIVEEALRSGEDVWLEVR